MAILDLEQNRIVVRVVYDGLANAGKTTNLRQLCTFFTTMRRSEFYVPCEENGRTLFFDWLQLEGGLVSGHKLRCQLLTVPGQRSLFRRRELLLNSADVVVYVCDSDLATLSFSRDRIGQVQRDIREGRTQAFAIVVQANKQDIPGAIPLESLRELLEIDQDVAIVPARADEGVGVRETAVLAIRAAANRMQTLILDRGADAFIGVAQSGEELYAAMLREEEGQIIWSLSDFLGDAPDPAVFGDAATIVDPSHSTKATLDEPAAAGGAVDAEPSDASPKPLVSTSGAAITNDVSFIEIEEERAGRQQAVPISLDDAVQPARTEVLPPLPRPDSLTGMVWPAGRGRYVIRQLVNHTPRHRSDLVARHGDSDGSGKSDAFIFEIGGWCVKTSARRRFDDPDEARNALLEIARFKVMLQELLLEDTALALQKDEESNYWLWTVAPWVQTLGKEMSEAREASDDERLGAALADYGQAVVESMIFASRRGVVLDVHPSNFARVGDRVCYLDDDFHRGTSIPTIGYSLLRRFDEFAPFEKAIDLYLVGLERRMFDRLSRADVDQLDLENSLKQTAVRTSTAEAARIYLMEVIRRCRRSTIVAATGR